MKLLFKILSFPFTTLAFTSKHLTNHAVPWRSSNALLEVKQYVHSLRCQPITTHFLFSHYEDEFKFITANCFFLQCIFSHVISNSDGFKSLPCIKKEQDCSTMLIFLANLPPQEIENYQQSICLTKFCSLKMPSEVIRLEKTSQTVINECG